MCMSLMISELIYSLVIIDAVQLIYPVYIISDRWWIAAISKIFVDLSYQTRNSNYETIC